MPLQGSRAWVRPGWAPPFGWAHTTRLADSCTEAVNALRPRCDGLVNTAGATRRAGQGDGASDGIQAMNELYRAKVPGNLPTIQTIASFMNDYQSLGRSAA